MTDIFKLPMHAVVLASLILIAAPLEAKAASDSLSPEQLLAMIQAQQKQLDALKAALDKAVTEAAEAKAVAQTASQGVASQSGGKVTLPKSFSLGGVIEVEGTNASTFAGVDSSDLTLAKVELELDAVPTDLVSAHVVLQYEDDGNENIVLDEAYATLGNSEKSPLYLRAGKWTMPFGGYGSDMNTSPLTKKVGETNEAAVLLGAAWSDFKVEGYVYNGDSQKAGTDDKIDQWGVAFGFATAGDHSAYSAGAGYLRNIADSSPLTTGLGNNATALNGYVSGLEAHAAATYRSITLRGGYLTATKSFQTGELAFNGAGAKPGAWNLEAAYATSINNRDLTFAATVQGTKQAVALGLPETRLGGTVTLGVDESAAVTFEYLRDRDYGTVDGGTGNDKHTATVKLAVEF
jgi:hypothetical protein